MARNTGHREEKKMSWMSEVHLELTSMGYSDEQIAEMPTEKAWDLAVGVRTYWEKLKAVANA